MPQPQRVHGDEHDHSPMPTAVSTDSRATSARAIAMPILLGRGCGRRLWRLHVPQLSLAHNALLALPYQSHTQLYTEVGGDRRPPIFVVSGEYQADEAQRRQQGCLSVGARGLPRLAMVLTNSSPAIGALAARWSGTRAFPPPTTSPERGLGLRDRRRRLPLKATALSTAEARFQGAAYLLDERMEDA